MKKVKCISPHGGGHNGVRDNGTPVHLLPDGSLPEVPPERLRLPPNPGGYIDCPSLGRGPIAVGSVIDVPDDWEINLAHFEWADEPAPQPPPAPAAPGTGE